VQDFVVRRRSKGAELMAVGPGSRAPIRTFRWVTGPPSCHAYAHPRFVCRYESRRSVVTVRNDERQVLRSRVNRWTSVGSEAAEPLYQALDKAMRIEIPDGSFRPVTSGSPWRLWRRREWEVVIRATVEPIPFFPFGSQSRPASTITIDTMQAGPEHFDQATPSTVVQGNFDNNYT
jgi:hypothetical protein